MGYYNGGSILVYDGATIDFVVGPAEIPHERRQGFPRLCRHFQGK